MSGFKTIEQIRKEREEKEKKNRGNGGGGGGRAGGLKGFGGPTGNVVRIYSQSQFTSALRNAGEKLVVVDFSATWCKPCQNIWPTYVSLSKKYHSCVFLTVDVDQCQDLAMRCNVRAMPTFQFYHNSNKVDEVVGGDDQKLEATIKKRKTNAGQVFTLGGTGTNPPSYATSNTTTSNTSNSATSFTLGGGTANPATTNFDNVTKINVDWDDDDDDDDVGGLLGVGGGGRKKKKSTGPVNQIFFEQLKSMGFPEAKCKLGLAYTQSKSLQAAMDWILDNPDRGNEGDKEADSITVMGLTAPDSNNPDAADTTNKEPEKELTPEEKEKIEKEKAEKKRILAEKRKKLQEKLAEERQKEAEMAQVNHAAREKERRRANRDQEELRRKYKEQQEEIELAKIKKRKKEEKLYREQVKRQMELDKLERKKKREAEKLAREGKAPAPTTTTTAKPTVVTPKKKSDSCLLNIRLPTNKSVRLTFKPSDTLNDVAKQLLSEGHVTGSIAFMTTFPRKKYPSSSTTTLEQAELAPRGNLVVLNE